MEYSVQPYLDPRTRVTLRQWLSANESRLETEPPAVWRGLGTSSTVEGFAREPRRQLKRLEPPAADRLPDLHVLTEDLAASSDPILPPERPP